MKILHVNKFLFPRGGAERYMFDVAAAQRRAGHAVYFFGTLPPRNAPILGRPYFPPAADFDAGVSWAAAARAIWSRPAAKALGRYIAETTPDVAHVHNIAYHLTPSVVEELGKAGVPTVMTLHDYNLICPNHYCFSGGEPCFRCSEGKYFACVTRRCIKRKWGASLVGWGAHLVARRRRVYRRVGVLIAPSRFLAQRVVASGYPASSLRVLPPAVDVSPPAPLPRGRYFLYVGRFAPEKGGDLLIEAAAAADVPVTLVGEGPAESFWRRRAQGVGARVEFGGRREPPEVASLMAAARAVVVPSVWPENTPAVIIEALAAGTPVIAARTGGIPEMFAHGREGILFPAGDRQGLVDALRTLAADDDLARRMGEAASRRFRAAFDFGRHLGVLEDIYREAAER